MSKPTELGQSLIKALKDVSQNQHELVTSNRVNSSVFKPIERLDLAFTKGGLGDSIARLPVVKYILENCSHIKSVRVFVQDYFLGYARHIFGQYTNVEFVGYSKMLETIETDPSKVGMNTDSVHHTTIRSHLTDHAFHTLLDEQPVDADAYNYVQMREPVTTGWEHLTNYVVITTGFTAAVREWPAKEINKVVHWLVEQNITPVFLGKTESVFWGSAKTEGFFRPNIQFELGINLIDSTSLLEASQIMSGARAVVGLDNGLLHLAAASDPCVPIIAAYTTVRSEHRLPYRCGVKGFNVRVIEPIDSSCRFCQSEARFVHQHDFRLCYFDDYECTKHITGEKFINELKYILEV